jgi:hypothetical protein
MLIKIRVNKKRERNFTGLHKCVCKFWNCKNLVVNIRKKGGFVGWEKNLRIGKKCLIFVVAKKLEFLLIAKKCNLQKNVTRKKICN